MTRTKSTNWYMIALSAIAMAYGWGYRGIVGHEGGAMIPGAMLGLSICIASQRADWQRRAMVAGLFGAVGFSWGGSLSYMEQTMYVQSDSWPDVLYGFSVLFFLGALWAGIAGATLGFAFTMPRSRLQQFTRVFTSICAAFLAFYLFFLFTPDAKEAYEQIGVDHFHDGEWLAAIIVLVVSAIHWAALKPDRHAAGLFFAGAVAWWIGYLGFTKFGGLLLAPAFRSESWGGVLGILIVLIAYLIRTKNRAALLLCRYGVLAGGFGFVLAVLIRHPMVVKWGFFGAMKPPLPNWKIAEESFGCFMGLGIAMGAARLEQGVLAPADEDLPRKPLDIFGAFVMLVALMWVNLRRAPMDWLERYKAVQKTAELGMMPWLWFTLGGAVMSAVVLYGLYLYATDRLEIAPRTARGKAALVFILLMWPTVIEGFVQTFPSYRESSGFVTDASLLALACIATSMVLRARAPLPLTQKVADPSAPRWRTGIPFVIVCAAVPFFIFAVATTAKSLQDGPTDSARLRFGPNAFWIKQSAMIGVWKPIGLAPKIGDAQVTPVDAGFASVEFLNSHNAIVTPNDGTPITDLHRWHYMNSLTYIDWNARDKDESKRASVPLQFRDNRMFMPWPIEKPGDQFLVFEHVK